MTVITETMARSGFYMGESAAHNIVNEEIIIASGAGVLVPGTVLGKITEVGTQTVGAAAAAAGNTGDGTVGSLTADAGAPAGTYQIVFVEPAANLGTFQVEKPDGSIDGTGVVGTAYNGTINFTIADGAADFVAGDRFTVAVSYAEGDSADTYVLHDAALTNGAEVAAAILFHKVDATSSAITTVATVRGPATINEHCLTFKSGISAANKLAAINALRDRGMTVLPQHAGA